MRTNRLFRIHALALTLITSGFPPATARANPGDLDTTLAHTGTSVLTFGGNTEFANGAVVQADGKLLLGGGSGSGANTGFELLRFGTNNLPDDSFGVGGAVFTYFFDELANCDAAVNALALQADGKILAAGRASHQVGALPYNNFALARYNPDGSLDTSFGIGGKVMADFGGQAQIHAIAVQPDGKILVGGTAYTNFAVSRYQTNGTLDSSFGTGGTVITHFASTASAPGVAAMLLTGPVPGDILTVGAGGNDNDFVLAMYTTNGVLDTNFSGSGRVFTSIPGATLSGARAVALQFGNNTPLNPNRLVVAGTAIINGQTFLALARYNFDGSLDTNFGGTGIITNSFVVGGSSDATGLTVQGSGISPRKITVSGFGTSSGETYFGMDRFNADGSLDTTFGSGLGRLALSFGPARNDEAFALTFQAGKIVLAGRSWEDTNGLNSDFAAVRFNSDGSVDTNFPIAGILTADVAGECTAQAVAVLPDGRIVAAGASSPSPFDSEFAVARYNPDGSTDTAFGNNGKATLQIGGIASGANAVQLQSDGKIVAAGYAYYSNAVRIIEGFGLARWNANGTLDTSFGTGGVIITAIANTRDQANGLAIQPDGKAVAAGFTEDVNGLASMAVARYTTNGTLDATFGGSGKVTTSFGSLTAATAAAAQSDGKLLVAGFAEVGPNTNFALVRYDPDGSLDSSFGSFGRVSTDFGAGNTSFANALAMQPDGKIVLAGKTIISGISYFALTRYSTNGALDSTFGTGGKVTAQLGLVSDIANGVAVMPNGKILVTGFSLQGSVDYYGVLRLNPDGSLDSSFGIGGRVLVNFGDGDDAANAIATDQVGRAVIAGSANSTFGITRLTSEPFLEITSITPTNSGQYLLKGLGVPDGNHTLNATSALSGGFSPLAPVSADAGGFWQYLDTTAAGIDMRFYRLSFP